MGSSDSRFKFIPDTVDGDQAVVRTVAIDLLPYTLDVRVNGARIAKIIVAPDFRKDLLAIHHLARMRSEQVKNFDFLGRKRNDLIVDLNLVGVEIELQTVKSQDRRLLARFSVMNTAEDSLDTCDHFARTERLDDVIIGSKLQP